MKKLLLHIVLLSYAIVMVKPAFPYLEDVVGHVLFYKQHMASVHYENGKYHVHAELAKSTKEDKSPKSPSNLKKQFSTTDHIVVTHKAIEPLVLPSMPLYPMPTGNDLLAGNLSYNYPPPRI